MITLAYTIRRALLVAPLFVFVLLTSGCNYPLFDSTLFSDDAWIASDGDSYRYYRLTQTADSTRAQLSFSGFYGKHSVWSIEATGETTIMLDLDISADLRGRYKVCFVAADKQVLSLESQPGRSSHALELAAGKHYIVLVGDAASGSITLHFYHDPEPRPYEIKILL